MQISPNLGLTIWNLGGDYYNHNELAANWNIIDTQLLKKTGDTATGIIRVQRTSGTSDAIEVKLDSEAQPRFKVRLDGLYWGDGSGSFDVRLFRGAVDNLRTPDQIESTYAAGPSFLSSDAATVALQGYKSSGQVLIENKLASIDSQPTWRIKGSGELAWGAGGLSAPDVRLYRSSAGKLTLEGDLEVDDLVADTLLLGGIPITGNSGGSGDINSSAAILTSNIVRARNGATGAVQLGNIDDPGIAAVYFGGSRDVSIYRDGADRLKTDDTFIVQLNLAVNSTASNSIETEGGIDVAGVSLLTGNVTMGSNATVANTLTVTNGLAVSGRSSIGASYLLGNLFRGKQIWFESSTNSNLYYLTNNAGSLEFHTTTYNAGGAGSSDTVRMSINSGGAVTMNAALSVVGAVNAAGLSSSGNVVASGNITASTGTISGSALLISNSAQVGSLTVNSFGTITGNLSVGGTLSAANISVNGSASFAGIGATFIVATTSASQLKSLLLSGGALDVQQDVGYVRSGTAYSGPPTVPNSVIGFDIVAWGRFYSPFAGVTAISDINKKRNLQRLETNEILTKIQSLDTLTRWQYDNEYVDEVNSMTGKNTPDFDADETFYGPSAQQFNQLFKPEVVERAKKNRKRRGGRKKKVESDNGVASPEPSQIFTDDDKMVNIYDVAGVALMGVQALIERVAELEAKLGEK